MDADPEKGSPLKNPTSQKRGQSQKRGHPSGATRGNWMKSPVSFGGQLRGRMPPMRRLARYLFSICSALSLLLCAAVIGLWLGGERFIFIAWLNGEGLALTAVSDGGLIVKFQINDEPDPWKPRLDAVAYHYGESSSGRLGPRELSVLYRPIVPDTCLRFGYTPDHEL